jgi:arylsulfatase A-like enzyme
LRPELETGKSRREEVFSAWNDGRPEALMIRRSVEPYRAVRTRTHKYIIWESKKQMLFDLRADPAEEKDLAGEAAHAATLQQMRQRLIRRMKATNDPALPWLGS